MRPALLALVIGAASSCAARGGVAAPDPQGSHTYRFVFAEDLVPETELCVHRTPWDAGVACMTLREFRQSVRGLRRASLEARR